MYVCVRDLKLMAKFSKNFSLVIRDSAAYLVAEVAKRNVYRAQAAMRLWTATPDMPSGCWALDLPAFSSINTASSVEVMSGMLRSGATQFPGAVSPAKNLVPGAILDNLIQACERSDFSDPYHTDTVYPVAVWELAAKMFKSVKVRGSRNTFVRIFPGEYLLYQDTDAHLCIGVTATL